MAGIYYKPCKELDRCIALDHLWHEKKFEEWFQEHLMIATETNYALAECQVGFAYLNGIGIQKDLSKAFYWTQRAALHGDRDAQFNLANMYEEGLRSF